MTFYAFGELENMDEVLFVNDGIFILPNPGVAAELAGWEYVPPTCVQDGVILLSYVFADGTIVPGMGYIPLPGTATGHEWVLVPMADGVTCGKCETAAYHYETLDEEMAKIYLGLLYGRDDLFIESLGVTYYDFMVVYFAGKFGEDWLEP